MSFYLAADIHDCRAKGHHFTVAGSDKTPLKRNLICRECSEANPGKTAYVAYGTDIGSFGQWRRRKIDDEEARP